MTKTVGFGVSIPSESRMHRLADIDKPKPQAEVGSELVGLLFIGE